MKKFVFLLCLFFALSFFLPSVTANAEEEPLGETLEEILSSLDTSELEEYLSSLHFEAFEGVSVKDAIGELIRGGDISYTDFFSYLLSCFREQLSSYASAFVLVLCICLFDGIVNSVKGDFLSDGVSNAVHYACYAAVLSLLLTCLIPVYTSLSDTVSGLKKQTELVFPVLIALMAGGGGTVSASLYQPAVAFLSQGIIQMMQNVIFPLALLIIGLSMVGNLSGKIDLNGFIRFFSSIAKWLIGIAFTLYSVCLTVQGIASSTYDSLSLKALKYAVGSGVPMIGGFLSGGMDLVFAGSILIKNAFGVFALILLFFTILSPLLSLVAFSLLLKLTAAIASPIADGRLCSFLEGLSVNTGYFTAGLLSVAFSYFVTVLLLICSSGVII